MAILNKLNGRMFDLPIKTSHILRPLKESICNVGELGSVSGLGRPPGEGNGYPLQCSCLENFMDRGTWQATVHGIAKSRTRLNDLHFHFME